MKKIVSVVLLGLTVAFTSCHDILDTKPQDGFSELDVWNDGSLAESFVYSTYASVVGMYVNQSTDDWTDNVITNDGSNIQTSNFDNTSDFGWNYFSQIRRCNLIIERLTGNENVYEGTRDKLVAEAKMMRAMVYYWQARRFGGIMLVDKVMTPVDEMKLGRTPEAEVYAFIMKDIEEAIPHLPATGTNARFTQGAGWAFLSRVALQAGNYAKVIAAANEVEALGYTLDTNYKNIFNSYAGTTTSKEVIFLYAAGKEYNIFYYTRMFGNLMNAYNGEKLRADAVPQFSDLDEFQAWPERWPSQELVDAYLIVENGVAVQKTGESMNGTPSRDFWKNRDKRFEMSIVHDSAQYRNSILTFRRGGNSHFTSNPLSTWGMSKSGYMFRKWMYEQEYFGWNYPLTWAEPLMRLSEVYLNKAEALGRTGKIAEAVAYTNKTRTVHGGLPELATTTTEADFWKYYKIERRVELSLEDDRYWSLVRWAKAENATAIPELNGYTLHALDMNFDGLVKVVASTFPASMKFEVPKRFYFPVPASQILQNENLTQNPGWN